ncbi:MAG: hypothetical protein SPG89_05570 [Prevotella sp.]|nr:hypothetical protein [Prevotella sp.]MDD7190349.1 hypothetical protein [Prevotella sp.]MDY5314065.1 hypothetical protein [Prevotella sp.]
MKKTTLLTLAAMALMASCQKTEDEKAASLMNKIDSLYKAGNYQATLNAITRLRANHPKAVESREKALKIWQDASLKMTQAEIGRTDSALQATIAQYGAEKDLYRKNMLRVKRDSLQVRYDALCGTVRVIHKRQAED